MKILKFLVNLAFKIRGWKVYGNIPKDIKKAVLVFAPHTSNWDGVYGLGTFLTRDIRIRFTIKKEMMFFPLNILLKKLGAIPIDRSNILGKRRTMADTIVDMYNNSENLYVLMQPEGTRKYVSKWKLGFYHVAVKANIPMILTYIDYPSNSGGFGPVIYPSGDIDKDLEDIRAFYKTIRGKYPENGIK